ncbi:hypothetical protein ACP2AV_10875 [Aliiroseovarius sp. PTFE2010]|uniref:hypothetical protein n=1 Tax=Aliiroseovarius sp. PTFE2010 TaxID=3417190 RepID=UPI003CEE3269
MATLMLAWAGGETITVERPGMGDDAVRTINPGIIFSSMAGHDLSCVGKRGALAVPRTG